MASTDRDDPVDRLAELALEVFLPVMAEFGRKVAEAAIREALLHFAGQRIPKGTGVRVHERNAAMRRAHLEAGLSPKEIASRFNVSVGHARRVLKAECDG